MAEGLEATTNERPRLLPPSSSPAGAGTGSPAQADGNSSASVSPSGVPIFGGGAPPTAGGVNSGTNAAVGGGGSSRLGGAGEGGESTEAPSGGLGGPGGEGGRAAAGDGEWGSKMGLQLSALFVQRALMVFRRERAAMVRHETRDTRRQRKRQTAWYK